MHSVTIESLENTTRRDTNIIYKPEIYGMRFHIVFEYEKNDNRNFLILPKTGKYWTEAVENSQY